MEKGKKNIESQKDRRVIIQWSKRRWSKQRTSHKVGQLGDERIAWWLYEWKKGKRKRDGYREGESDKAKESDVYIDVKEILMQE